MILKISWQGFKPETRESISNHHRVIVAGSLLTFLCDHKNFSNQNLKSNTFRKKDNFYNCHFLTHFYCWPSSCSIHFGIQAIPPPPRRFMAPVPTIEVVPNNWGHVRKKKPGRCLQGWFPSSIGTIGTYIYITYIYIYITYIIRIYIYGTSSIKQQPVSQISSSQATIGLTSAHRDARRWWAASWYHHTVKLQWERGCGDMYIDIYVNLYIYT